VVNRQREEEAGRADLHAIRRAKNGDIVPSPHEFAERFFDLRRGTPFLRAAHRTHPGSRSAGHRVDIPSAIMYSDATYTRIRIH
jgi:hypothetical protein